jgi:hypothetical protein
MNMLQLGNLQKIPMELLFLEKALKEK